MITTATKTESDSEPTVARRPVAPVKTHETQEQYQVDAPTYRGGPLVFDIETMPLDEATIRERSAPFTPSEQPGEFDRSSVKVGNLKDPDKIAAKIREAKEAHHHLVENYAANCVQQEGAYWAGIIEKAPLHPHLGRVLAIGIGYQHNGKDANHYLCLNQPTDADEAWLLSEWWDNWYTPAVNDAYNVVGHNILEFDIPFLVRRSWMLGVDIPEVIVSKWHLNSMLIDTANVWKCGSRQAPYIKLDDLGRYFRVGGKPVDNDGEKMSGGDFHKLYWGTSEERNKAMDYLANDVDLTRKVARRMGLV